MRIFAQYDSKGTIRALITVEGREGAVAMPTPPPGLFVTEIEGVKIDGRQIKSGTPDMVGEIRAIAKSYKGQIPLPRCTLTRKG